MIIYVDIDGTICSEIKARPKKVEHYLMAEPYVDRIIHVNKLYDEGHEIHYWTARGASSGLDHYDLTKKQLEEWGCKYHELHVGNKPHFDIYVCDKSFNSEDWFTQS